MNFTQVCSQWMKTVMPLWDEMMGAEKWMLAGILASVLLLIISLWSVL